jgi:hypothetical protein
VGAHPGAVSLMIPRPCHVIKAHTGVEDNQSGAVKANPKVSEFHPGAARLIFKWAAHPEAFETLLLREIILHPIT